jgi:predicted O-methyltransferase YrrM
LIGTWTYPIDLLFIDACHNKENVLRDFENYSKFVCEGTGLILLHDTHPISEEIAQPYLAGSAWEAAWEIRMNSKFRSNFEIVTLPGPSAGLSIIRKSKKQLCWKVED